MSTFPGLRTLRACHAFGATPAVLKPRTPVELKKSEMRHTLWQNESRFALMGTLGVNLVRLCLLFPTCRQWRSLGGMRKRPAVVAVAVLVAAGAGVGLVEALSGPASRLGAEHPASGAAAYRHAGGAGRSATPTTAPTPALAASGSGATTGPTTTTEAPTASAGGPQAVGGGTDSTKTAANTPATSDPAWSSRPATTVAQPSTSAQPSPSTQPTPASGGVCGSSRGACAADTVTVGPSSAPAGPVPLAATVKPASTAANAPTPSGYVEFSVDMGHGMQPASCSQAPSGPHQGVVPLDAQGTATCTVTLRSGSYPVGALYVSDTGAYRGGASAPTTVRVS